MDECVGSERNVCVVEIRFRLASDYGGRAKLDALVGRKSVEPINDVFDKCMYH